jgi:hypothetical protein
VQGSSSQSKNFEQHVGTGSSAVREKSKVGQIRWPKDTDTEGEEDIRQSKKDDPWVGATTTSHPTHLAQTRTSKQVEQRVTAPTVTCSDDVDSSSLRTKHASRIHLNGG